jgi:gliding motility-associated-like protein
VVVYPGEAYSLEPGTNCLYFSWFPPSGISNTNVSNPVFDPEVRTRYFVTATTEQGCEIKDSIDVLVKETIWDIPNAFAPAGNNNIFRPAIRGLATLKQFVIFNRWGNKVYSSTDINSGWDGTFNGQPQPAGVYIYLIDGVTDKGNVLHKQGNVTLLR